MKLQSCGLQSTVCAGTRTLGEPAGPLTSRPPNTPSPVNHPFTTTGGPLASGPFWVSDDDAWEEWIDRIHARIALLDPWALLVMRPDCDMVLVDVLEGWAERVRRFNGRTVWFVRPDGWEP